MGGGKKSAKTTMLGEEEEEEEGKETDQGVDEDDLVLVSRRFVITTASRIRGAQENSGVKNSEEKTAATLSTTTATPRLAPIDVETEEEVQENKEEKEEKEEDEEEEKKAEKGTSKSEALVASRALIRYERNGRYQETRKIKKQCWTAEEIKAWRRRTNEMAEFCAAFGTIVLLILVLCQLSEKPRAGVCAVLLILTGTIFCSIMRLISMIKSEFPKVVPLEAIGPLYARSKGIEFRRRDQGDLAKNTWQEKIAAFLMEMEQAPPQFNSFLGFPLVVELGSRPLLRPNPSTAAIHQRKRMHKMCLVDSLAEGVQCQCRDGRSTGWSDKQDQEWVSLVATVWEPSSSSNEEKKEPGWAAFAEVYDSTHLLQKVLSQRDLLRKLADEIGCRGIVADISIDASYLKNWLDDNRTVVFGFLRQHFDLSSVVVELSVLTLCDVHVEHSGTQPAVVIFSLHTNPELLRVKAILTTEGFARPFSPPHPPTEPLLLPECEADDEVVLPTD